MLYEVITDILIFFYIFVSLKYKKIITHPLKAAVGANIITEFIPDKISPLILKLEEYSELLKEGDEYRKSLFLNNLSENVV